MLLLLACVEAAPDDDTASVVEPLDLPADPAENGAPVGVRTVQSGDQTIEVWYPAAESAAGEATEIADFGSFIPQSVYDALGEFDLPPVPTGAVRDAPLRNAGEVWPVVVFSHGFGGMRIQSLDYAVHLASRGYVVVSADHPGRMMGDILPCVFEPALEGCDLSGMTGSDPAVEDLDEVVSWLVEANEAGDFAGALDLDHLVMSGHSAGGGTTETILDADTRFMAGISMAAGAAPTRDVPLLLMGGTCDAFADDPSMSAAHDRVPGSLQVRVIDAGHLAFADLCELDLIGLAEKLLVPRDDMSEFLLDQLIALAGDGCPGAVPVASTACSGSYLPLGTSDPIVRYYTTVFLDSVTRGEGPGVTGGVYAEADVP